MTILLKVKLSTVSKCVVCKNFYRKLLDAYRIVLCGVVFRTSTRYKFKLVPSFGSFMMEFDNVNQYPSILLLLLFPQALFDRKKGTTTKASK